MPIGVYHGGGPILPGSHGSGEGWERRKKLMVSGYTLFLIVAAYVARALFCRSQSIHETKSPRRGSNILAIHNVHQLGDSFFRGA